jgi:hypothetical protein
LQGSITLLKSEYYNNEATVWPHKNYKDEKNTEKLKEVCENRYSIYWYRYSYDYYDSDDANIVDE